MKPSTPPTQILASSASDAQPVHDAPHALAAPGRREFVRQVALGAAALSAVGLAGCGGSDDPPAPSEFKYGVASGDPLTDRVILWTHAKIANSVATVRLSWQVATDSAFANVVSKGAVDATEAAGFTAKVDATGLAQGQSYFYRFIDSANVVSPVGATRTLPAAGVASLKFAVFSCTLYSEGFFNVYDAASKSDAQYALHLGDYIYEYGADPAQFGNSTAVALGRVVAPTNDIVSLSDYRTRYALYRSDATLQALHAKMPWITVWDDHEFANNAYVGGAENHNTAKQGDWTTRKNIAAKVYHEWMPIRSPLPAGRWCSSHSSRYRISRAPQMPAGASPIALPPSARRQTPICLRASLHC